MFMLSGQPELALVSDNGVVIAAEVEKSFLQMSLLIVFWKTLLSSFFPVDQKHLAKVATVIDNIQSLKKEALRLKKEIDSGAYFESQLVCSSIRPWSD